MTSFALVAALAAVLSIAGCGGGEGAAGDIAPALKSGQIDTTFGNSGSVVFAASEGFSDMAVAPDGSIYVTGHSVARLDSRGIVDLSYGVTGRAPIESLSPLLDPSGNLYVISGNGIAKLDPVGRPVSSFGVDGRVAFALGQFEVLERLARDPEGNLYVAGTVSGVATPKQVVVRKVDPNGRPVASFGADGTRLVQTRAFVASVAAMALDAGRNLFVAGLDYIPAAGAGPNYMFTLKLDADGKLDPGFGNGGVWLSAECWSFSGARSLAFAAPDQLIVGGECHPFGMSLQKATVQKLDSKGERVASFQDAGWILFGPTVTGGPVVESMIVAAIRARQDGVIHAAGQRRGPGSCPDAAAAKLDAEGQFIPRFGADGVALLAGMNDVRAMDLDAAGRLYIGGYGIANCPAGVDQATFIVVRLGG